MSKIGLILGTVLAAIALTLADFISSDGKSTEMRQFSQNADDKCNPCWLLSSEGFDSVTTEIISERQDRQMFGYSDGISLVMALEIFNQEQKC